MSTNTDALAEGYSGALSPAPVDDEATITPFLGQMPDDILSYICTALDSSRDGTEPYAPPTDEDKIVQRTLLSLQLVSKAGWIAATPFVWKVLTLRKEDDYVSFFSPITLFSGGSSHILDDTLRETDIRLRAQVKPTPPALTRFYKAARWIGSIVIDFAPPSITDGVMQLAGELASGIGEHVYRLGQGEVGLGLYIGGEVCPMMEDGGVTPGLVRLSTFAADFTPNRITLFDIPAEIYSKTGWFWKWFNELAYVWFWDDLPLSIINAQPGQLRFLNLSSVKARLDRRTRWYDVNLRIAQRPVEPDQLAVHEIGEYIVHRLEGDDPLFKYTSLDIDGHWECPCAYSAFEHSEWIDTERDLIRRVIIHVNDRMGIQDDSDSTFSDAIWAAFEQYRLTMPLTLCSENDWQFYLASQDHRHKGEAAEASNMASNPGALDPPEGEEEAEAEHGDVEDSSVGSEE